MLIGCGIIAGDDDPVVLEGTIVLDGELHGSVLVMIVALVASSDTATTWSVGGTDEVMVMSRMAVLPFRIVLDPTLLPAGQMVVRLVVLPIGGSPFPIAAVRIADGERRVTVTWR
jgi:hypothetical protein